MHQKDNLEIPNFNNVFEKFIEQIKVVQDTLLPDFPFQNTLTQDIRKTSAAQNNQEFISLWSGQSPRLTKNQTVELLIKNIIAEAKRINSYI